jgi:hypothetical protein
MIVVLVLVVSGVWGFLRCSGRPAAEASGVPAVKVREESSTVAAEVSATSLYTAYLPLVLNNYPIENHIGVQFYGALHTTPVLTLTSEGGSGWIRYPLMWRHVEPENTTPEFYNWSRIDRSLAAAQNVGIEVLLTIRGQPEWAASHPMGDPYDRQELVEFVNAAVERYDGDGFQDAPGDLVVHYFELYNEPDMTVESVMGAAPWGYKGEEYASLLALLYPGLKAASPQAKLVVGGLASDNFDDKGGAFARAFLDDVLSACEGIDCFDVMNFHYYPAFHKEWDPYGPGFVGKANYFRQKLEAYGKGDKELICTETGSRGHPDWGGDEQQSRYLVKAFVRGQTLDLPIVIWFTALDTTIPESLYGLYDEDFNSKPSYEAMATTSRMIIGAKYVRALDSQETGSPDLEGYLFSRTDGRRLIVIWTEDSSKYNPDDNPTVPFTINKPSLTVTDKYGQSTQWQDSNDGVVDNKVTLWIDGSPVFIEY